jgi:hypothetical protein
MTMINIHVMGENLERVTVSVKAKIVGDLAVCKDYQYNKSWVITHVKSGLKVMGRYLSTQKRAVAIAEQLQEALTGWSCANMQEIVQASGLDRDEFQDRMIRVFNRTYIPVEHSTMTNTKHTHTPRQLLLQGNVIYGAYGRKIAMVQGSEKAQHDAEYMVNAANCHEDLLEALELILEALEDVVFRVIGAPSGYDSQRDKARAAIAKAKG